MPLPSEMRCIETTTFGGPEVMVLGSRPIPLPAASEVLIKVEAAGVNRSDLLQREGKYPPPAGASDILGLEVGGTVVSCGEGVLWPAVGEQVCALLTGGGYAEYVVASASMCLPQPEGLDSVKAAALPETFCTVWHNVFQLGGLQAGESFLVHGGASGIGTTAIQMAKAFGVKVFATVRGQRKREACVSLGCDRAIDYGTEDFVKVIVKETGARGVDLILDMVGGDYLPRNLECLAMNGRHISIAFLRGDTVELDLRTVMTKRLVLTGSTLRSQPIAAKAAIIADLHRKIWPLLAAGKIIPVIHGTLRLALAQRAHEILEESTHIGKIVLTS